MASAHRPEIDTSRPHSARVYDYYLGGKDWFAVDKETAEEVIAGYPMVRTWARENRAFMHRATRTLVRDHGVRQFLDLGTGIPTEPNLHQIAQAEAPETRVVYVDNDPLVVEYTDVLMRGTPEGHTTYAEADVLHDDLLQLPQLHATLDFTQPVALSMVALLHFFPDHLAPQALVRRLVAALPSGSFLVLSHGTHEFGATEEENAANRAAVGGASDIYRRGGTESCVRGRVELATFFEGLELLDPGIVIGHRWRPDGPVQLPDDQVRFLAGVARKP